MHLRFEGTVATGDPGLDGDLRGMQIVVEGGQQYLFTATGQIGRAHV